MEGRTDDPSPTTATEGTKDTGGPDAALKFVDRAGATHPSLIDAAHELDQRLGIRNVPSGVWIDEAGTIVRPPEPGPRTQ